MSSVLERSLGIIELLAKCPQGMSLRDLSAALGQPQSGAHRILNELMKFGYVQQLRDQGEYALTIKMSAIGLSYLSRCGITDVAQPILDKLANDTGELVRLSVLEGKNLIWVGVAQGATGGLRYDPGREQGVSAHFASTASGQAYLSTMDEDDALLLVAEQGLTPEGLQLGTGAPAKVSQLIKVLSETRKRGYSISENGYLEGMTAIAVPVREMVNQKIVGCVSVAGPQVRMPQSRIDEIVPVLTEAAAAIGEAADASEFIKRAKN